MKLQLLLIDAELVVLFVITSGIIFVCTAFYVPLFAIGGPLLPFLDHKLIESKKLKFFDVQKHISACASYL